MTLWSHDYHSHEQSTSSSSQYKHLLAVLTFTDMSINCATLKELFVITNASPAAPRRSFPRQQDLVLSRSASALISAIPTKLRIENYTNAVVRAVQLGANVIDTAANYRFQRSERSIGDALQTLANEHGIARDELVICTKGGYLPFDGAPPRNVREYVERLL